MFENQQREEGYPDLELEEDFILSDGKENHCKYIIIDISKYKNKIHSLRWEVYMIEKEELINIEVLVVVSHTKGGKIIWTFGENNIIRGNQDHKDVGLR